MVQFDGVQLSTVVSMAMNIRPIAILSNQGLKIISNQMVELRAELLVAVEHYATDIEVKYLHEDMNEEALDGAPGPLETLIEGAGALYILRKIK